MEFNDWLEENGYEDCGDYCRDVNGKLVSTKTLYIYGYIGEKYEPKPAPATVKAPEIVNLLLEMASNYTDIDTDGLNEAVEEVLEMAQVVQHNRGMRDAGCPVGGWMLYDGEYLV